MHEVAKPPSTVSPHQKVVLHHGSMGKKGKVKTNTQTHGEWDLNYKAGMTDYNVMQLTPYDDHGECDLKDESGMTDHDIRQQVPDEVRTKVKAKAQIHGEWDLNFEAGTTAHNIMQPTLSNDHDECDLEDEAGMTDHGTIIDAERKMPHARIAGCNYMKCSPLTSTGHIGSTSRSPQDILNDVCSNVSLMDLILFNERYPNVKIDTTHTIKVDGIGQSATIGHCRIPVWMKGHNANGKACLIKMDIEFHLIENFEHRVLLGMDTLSDYGIDFHLSIGKARLGPLSYPITYNQKSKTVLIHVKENTTIYGRTCKKIPIKSHMLREGEYIFTPYQFLQQGQPIVPSLSLPYAILDNSV